MFNKCLTKTPFHDPVGFAPGGRASLALPLAILRVAAEKAGAGMCWLGLGQGGNPVYVHPFASSATEVFQRFTILMRSDASLAYNRSIVLYADNPVLGRTLTSLAGYVIWYSFPALWLVGDGCTGN